MRDAEKVDKGELDKIFERIRQKKKLQEGKRRKDNEKDLKSENSRKRN